MPGIGRTSRTAVSKMTGIFLHPAPLASNAPPPGALCLRLTASRSRPAAPCFARTPHARCCCAACSLAAAALQRLVNARYLCALTLASPLRFEAYPSGHAACQCGRASRVTSRLKSCLRASLAAPVPADQHSSYRSVNTGQVAGQHFLHHSCHASPRKTAAP